MFEKLIFKNEYESNEFKKYIQLKGECLHNQIYDILNEANNGSVTYYELSSLIRYDKNLREKFLKIQTFKLPPYLSSIILYKLV